MVRRLGRSDFNSNLASDATALPAELTGRFVGKIAQWGAGSHCETPRGPAASMMEAAFVSGTSAASPGDQARSGQVPPPASALECSATGTLAAPGRGQCRAGIWNIGTRNY